MDELMISIIIPFYNEAESIPVLVENLNNQLNKLKKEFHTEEVRNWL